MADITVTPSLVAQGAGAAVDSTHLAGETITDGQSLYVKISDNRLYKAKAGGTAAEAVFYGIALHASLAGHPLECQIGGPITIGGTVVVGVVYGLTVVYGGIGPISELVSTNKLSIIGYGTSVTVIQMSPINTGVAVT